MKPVRLLFALAAALLCAALLAGCGGTSKADYQKQVKKVGTHVMHACRTPSCISSARSTRRT
jgi:ABC-type oligopeptide transport system substrate-binding subunit